MKQLIYCVDDDEFVNEVIEKRVKALGFRFQSFLDVDALMAATKKELPNLLLVDIYIGDKPLGLIIVHIFKKKFPKIPIIVISTTSSNEIITRAFEEGADDFTYKPIRRETFANKITQHLGIKNIDPDYLYYTPRKETECKLHFNLKIIGANEEGFILSSPYYIKPGTKLSVQSEVMHNIFGVSNPMDLIISSTEFQPKINIYQINTCLDESDTGKRKQLQEWLKDNIQTS